MHAGWKTRTKANDGANKARLSTPSRPSMTEIVTAAPCSRPKPPRFAQMKTAVGFSAAVNLTAPSMAMLQLLVFHVISDLVLIFPIEV